MSAQPCSSRDLVDLNRSKEYTLIATELLESVLTDARLNAQTSKLWQILFNQARYHPNFQIKISYSYLAKKLGKSARTIARYVEALHKTGYLIIEHNFDKNGGQRPSTLAVRVPEKTIEHVKKKKDRLNKKTSFRAETVISENQITADSNQFSDKNKITAASTIENHDINPDVLCGTVINHNEPSLTDMSTTTNQNIHQSFSTAPAHSATMLPDNFDRGGHDTLVIQKDNNKKEINKNNNNVVVFNHDKITIDNLQSQIKQLENQLSTGQKQVPHITNHAARYNLMRKNSEIQANLHLSKIALDKMHRKSQEHIHQANNRKPLQTDATTMFAKPGQRCMSDFTFKRLMLTLKSYGHEGNQLNTLINEIVFEARFGSLIQCHKTKTQLSLDKAINIALKLVRENRWATPTGLKC